MILQMVHFIRVTLHDPFIIRNKNFAPAHALVYVAHPCQLPNRACRWHLTARHPWDSPLSKQASTELAEVAAQLSALQLRDAVIITSPFTRCLQTSVQILHHLPVGAITTGHVCRGVSEVFSAWLMHRTAHHNDVKLLVRLRRWWWLLRRISHAAILLKTMTSSIASTNVEAAQASASSSNVTSLQAHPWPQFPETEQGAGVRYVKAVSALVDQFKGRDLLIVTHGNCVKAWTEHCLPREHVDLVKPGGFIVLQPTSTGESLVLHQCFPMTGVELHGGRHIQLLVDSKHTESPGLNNEMVSHSAAILSSV